MHLSRRLRTPLLVILSALVHQSNVLSAEGVGSKVATIEPLRMLNNQQAVDQDDMCVWVDRARSDQSLIICSDKTANFIFVYNLSGELLQSISVPKPGNIDVRQDIPIGNDRIDLIVVNQRSSGQRLVPFKVNSHRQLEPICSEQEPLLTGRNYGGCLAHDTQSKRTYFFSTSDAGVVEQFEIVPATGGRVKSQKVREIPMGKCEGAVADDLSGCVFVAEETRGVWKLPISPHSTDTPTLICQVGHGLTGDLEGVTIARRPNQDDWLLVSDQGRSCIVAFQAKAPYARIGEFSIQGATETDGIEAVTISLGPSLPHGIFLNHTDIRPRSVLLTPWQLVEKRMLSK